MNDLMTKSFLSYVELKKQALKQEESMPDLEMGTQLNLVDEQNLSKFIEEVAAIKTHMEEITNLLMDIQGLNEDTKCTRSSKILAGTRDRIKSDMFNVLRKAKSIKEKLSSLDQSNIENRNVSLAYKEGSPVDRTRVSVTNGLRVKLREMMLDFQSLREQIVKDHKEGLKMKYFKVTGEKASEEVIEKMILGGRQEKVFREREDLAMEAHQRQEALKEIQRSLTELHHVFIDMAVFVEIQEDKMNDIEMNVAEAGDYINGGTNGLFCAEQMKKKRRNWTSWISASMLLIVLFMCLVSILAS